jgi:hypothetical protein
MEEAAQFLGGERYFGAWGLRYEVHAYAPVGRRIRNLRGADGRPIHARRRLKVAFNSYHLAGGGGRFPVLVERTRAPAARLRMHPASMRDAVMDYVRSRPVLDVAPGTNAAFLRQEPLRRGRSAVR